MQTIISGIGFATLIGFAVLMLADGTSTAAESDTAPAAGPKRVVGYFTEWNDQYPASSIPADRLTHVNYAFARIRNGECVVHNPAAAIERRFPDDANEEDAAFRGHFRQLNLLKQRHPHLRTLISIGGWGGSEQFSDAALTEESRRKFARSCAAFVHRYGFDGVDIDWEFPAAGIAEGNGRAEDTRNFTLLLEELRKQLDEQGRQDLKHYLLTIAAPAGPQNYRNIELAEIHPYLDWINLMTYDYTGTWSKLTGLNAPLFTARPEEGALSVDRTVRAYLSAGVPAEKLVLGVPFFGRAFGGVGNEDHGLFQPHDGKTPKAEGAAGWSYRVLAEHYINKSARRFWHDRAKVPWLYDEGARLMVSYDDPESLGLKAAYAREHGLGGVMIWELSQDDAEHSLLRAVTDGLAQ